jgi:tetratricopeptide (TPR) repeat protein
MIIGDYLRQAYEINPLSVNTLISLARLNRTWADSTQDTSRLSNAEKYYSDALTGKPYRVAFWVEWAEFRVQVGDLQGARQKIDSALKIDNAYAPAYGISGKLYFAEAESQSDPAVRAELFNQAANNFRTQIELMKSRTENPALALFDLGDAYNRLNQFGDAREAYFQAAEFDAGDFQWQLYKAIADVSAQLKDAAAQLEYLQKAFDLAPDAVKPALQEELNKIIP